MRIPEFDVPCDIDPAELRRMSGNERVQIAMDMTEKARVACFRRLRSENPDWSDAQIMYEFFRLIFLPEPLPPDFKIRPDYRLPVEI